MCSQDNIPADTRVAAERKLKAQEVELQKAETVRMERTMAIRYHKVKFFGIFTSITLLPYSQITYLHNCSINRTSKGFAQNQPDKEEVVWGRFVKERAKEYDHRATRAAS